MNPLVYRITGVESIWDSELRKYVRGGERVTVRRHGGDLAYYEDWIHAKRGLTGLKRWGSYFDMRIEDCGGTWEEVPS